MKQLKLPITPFISSQIKILGLQIYKLSFAVIKTIWMNIDDNLLKIHMKF